MKGLTRVERDGEIYAIVLRKEYDQPGPSFFTPGEFSQQLGMLVHPKGKEVKRHRHKLVKREIFRTQEVLLLLVEYPEDGQAAQALPLLQNYGLEGLLVSGVQGRLLGAVFGQETGDAVVSLLTEALQP